MPRLEYFLVAESISVDRETNQLSVFNVLDDLELSLPTQIPQLVALSSWNIEPHERDQDLQVMLRILLPKADGTVLVWRQTHSLHSLADFDEHLVCRLTSSPGSHR